MRKFVVIIVLSLSMIGIGASAAYNSQAFIPVVYKQLSTPPTPQPSGIVEVLPNYSWFVDSGNLVIMGEVQNNTSEYADLIEITVDIYNSLGQLIGPYTTYTYLDNALAPGDKTFFTLSIAEPPDWADFEFEKPTYEVGGDPPPDLTIMNYGSAWDSTNSRYYVWAQVRNDDVVDVDFTHAIITVYDTSGKVIAGGFVLFEPRYLVPGQLGDFMTYFADQDYSNVTYRLQVDGSRQLP